MRRVLGSSAQRSTSLSRLIKSVKSLSHPSSHGLNERFSFIWSYPFIVSVFVQHGRTKAVTSHLFIQLFMFIHLPLIHLAPPPRLLIDFKSTYFCILLCICYCFSHLISLLSVRWLSLLYKFTRFLKFIFCFLSDEGPMLETLDYTTCIGSTPTFLYFDLYLYSAYDTTFMSHIARLLDSTE